MATRAVISDIGGVLIRVEHPAGRSEWEARLGLAEGAVARAMFESEMALRAALGEVPESEVWKYATAALGIDERSLAAFMRDFWRGEELDIELVKFLRGLCPVKFGIISNAWSDARAALNRKYNMDTLADLIVYSAEVKLAKPDPRIYRLALEQLDVAPEEAIFVDDVPENVKAARALGMRGTLFQNTSQVIDEIKGYLHGDSS